MTFARYLLLLLISLPMTAWAEPAAPKRLRPAQLVSTLGQASGSITAPLRPSYDLNFRGRVIPIKAGPGNACTLTFNGSPSRCTTSLSFKNPIKLNPGAVEQVMALTSSNGWSARMGSRFLRATGSNIKVSSMKITAVQQADNSYKGSFSFKGKGIASLLNGKEFQMNFSLNQNQANGKSGNVLPALNKVVDLKGVSGKMQLGVTSSKALSLFGLKTASPYTQGEVTVEFREGKVRAQLQSGWLDVAPMLPQ